MRRSSRPDRPQSDLQPSSRASCSNPKIAVDLAQPAHRARARSDRAEAGPIHGPVVVQLYRLLKIRAAPRRAGSASVSDRVYRQGVGSRVELLREVEFLLREALVVSSK